MLQNQTLFKVQNKIKASVFLSAFTFLVFSFFFVLNELNRPLKI